MQQNAEVTDTLCCTGMGVTNKIARAVAAENLVKLLADMTLRPRQKLEQESHGLKCRGKTRPVNLPPSSPQLGPPQPPSEAELLFQEVFRRKATISVSQGYNGAFCASGWVLGFNDWDDVATKEIAEVMVKESLLKHLRADSALATRWAMNKCARVAENSKQVWCLERLGLWQARMPGHTELGFLG